MSPSVNPLIPEGMVEGWKIVRPDFTTRNGYRWPFPGGWATCPDDTNFTTGDPCPSDVGDGLCVAKTWIVSGAPAWDRAAIVEWAGRTGRLTESTDL